MKQKYHTVDDYLSECCTARVETTDPLPDFIGEDPTKQKIGTISFICTKCKKLCDVIPFTKHEPPNVKIDFSDLKKTIKDIEKSVKSEDTLMPRILEYLKIKGIGNAIADGCDLIMRLRLGQLNIVSDILQRNCSLYQESRGPNIEEPLYKAIELGELLKCYQEKGKCIYAKDCWITRKGTSPCRNKTTKSVFDDIREDKCNKDSGERKKSKKPSQK